MQIGKRLTALFLCVLLAMSILPTALAADIAPAATAQEAPLTLTQGQLENVENGKTASVELKLENTSAKEISTDLILALYETDTNAMQTYVTHTLQVAASNELVWNPEIKIPAEGSYTLKAFAWDSMDNLNLLSNVLVVDPNAQTCGTVTLSIEKRTIGKGDLLPAVEVELHKGDTAWTLLQREMDARNYTYEASENAQYGSIYLSSIEGDGEFDHGQTSGWMYCVNDVFPDYGLSKYELQDGDVFRVRYTTNATDVRNPLVQLLKSIIEDTETMLAMNHGKYTESTEKVVRDALAAAKEIAQDEQYNTGDTDKELVVSQHIAAIHTAVEGLKEADTPQPTEPSKPTEPTEPSKPTVPTEPTEPSVPTEPSKPTEPTEPTEPSEPTEPTIPDDWENDIWLNSDFQRLAVGDTYQITARRLPELVGDVIQNSGLTLPPMHYTVVSGEDVVSISDSGLITADKEGVAVIQVRYDEIQPEWSDKVFGACSPVNYAYMTVEVNDSPADVTITTNLDQTTQDDEKIYHTYGTTFDTVYFLKGNSVAYPFTVSADKDAALTVTCNDQVLTGENGTYTAQLENRTNVIQIKAELDGKTKYQAYSIDARKIEITVTNLTAPGTPLNAGDQAAISFKGITIPVSKLATIYNPCFASSWGGNSSGVQYTVNGETVYGRCGQWDLATKNTIKFTFEEEGTYTFSDGCIDMWWWGAVPGAHKELTKPGEPNLNAGTLHAKMSIMPEFTVTVNAASNRPATGVEVTPKTGTGELAEGGENTIQLHATVLPLGASNQNVTWSTSDKSVATVDSNGLVTCVGIGNATITATTEDGNFTDTASITVVQEFPATPAEKNQLRTLVNSIAQLNEKEYSEDSWAAVCAARDAAQKVLDDDTVLLEEVNRAYAALEEAKKALEPIKMNLTVEVSPKSIHPGDTVTITLKDLPIPQPETDFWITARETVYNTDIPGLETVKSGDGSTDGEAIRTLTFTIPQDTKPGTYSLSAGHVYCCWVVFPQSMLTNDAKYYEGRMPDIPIEVTGKPSANQVVITNSDLEANPYETYYHTADKEYVYQGEVVTFTSESQFTAGGKTYDLKNKEIIVEVLVEGDTATVKLNGVSAPVGLVPSKWNSTYAGIVQLVYQTDIPEQAEIRSASGSSLNDTVTIKGLTSGTYHLTGGTIYEKANQWSPGMDFGNGTVTEAFFGVLPDVTIVVP